MVKIFFDTDIGGDCDDAGALALLCGMQRQGKCKIVGATSTTARRGAADCIRAIGEYYGCDFPVGALRGEPFMASEEDNIYARCFDRGCAYEDSVRLFRRAAHENDRIAVVAVGPLRNIALFLKSGPDDVSPMSGAELFREKVSLLCIMGGCFEQTYYGGSLVEAEYNIVQDIPSAQYVAEHCTCPIVFSPFELGNTIFTGKNVLQSEEHPVGLCYRKFNEKWHTEGQQRQSWDDLTAYYAVEGDNRFLFAGKEGEVRFSDAGISVWKEKAGGGHRILYPRSPLHEIEDELNSYIR